MIAKPRVLTPAHTSSIVSILASNPRYEAAWERAIDYLASHAGRWVPGWELADAVYGGHCSRSAVPMLIKRAKRYFRVESDPNLGYRIGRADLAEALCKNCGARRVRYQDEWVCYGCPSTAVVDLEVGRAGYAEGSDAGKAWKPEEDAFIREHHTSMGDREMAELLNRSPNGVRSRRATLELGPKKYVRAE